MSCSAKSFLPNMRRRFCFTSLQAEYADLLTEKKKAALNTLWPARKCGICRWQRLMLPGCLGMMKKRRRRKKRLSAKNNAELFLWSPGKNAWAFSPAADRASARKSVPKERAASSAKELFGGLGGAPQQAILQSKQCRVCTTLHCLPVLSLTPRNNAKYSSFITF